MHVPEFVNKIKSTMQERYGVSCAMNVPEFRKKYEETCLEKYGTSYYVNSEEYATNVCASARSKINDHFRELASSKGIELVPESIYDSKRFDFEVVGRKVLIEIDPSYTHNVAGNHWDKKGLPKEQQLIKTAVAEKYGYRCIHVFDWDNWEDVLDLMQEPDCRVYARKCTVKEIKDKSYDEFIDTNHIQKQCKGTKVALGLYYGDELVQVMTFGQPRYNKNYQWELLRLCSKKGVEVVGGASKLFKYATTQLHLDSIISYCDRSKFTGTVYTKIGMKLLRRTEPQEVWSKGHEKITSSLLRQRGFDQLFDANYGKGTSNEELMLQHGWLPVYDCGQLVFTYGQPLSKESEHIDQLDSLDYVSMLQKVSKEKEERNCLFCGKPFIPKSNFQKYCKGPHFMKCPVCGKDYEVKYNEALAKGPVACSYACRAAKTKQTSLDKYGVSAPGNNKQAIEKRKQTMLDRYGVEYAMESSELKQRAKDAMIAKYGVENIRQSTVDGVSFSKDLARNQSLKLLESFPLSMQSKEDYPSFRIDDAEMKVYMLTAQASKSFLTQYGFVINPHFHRKNLSLGLVKDGVLYQVIRFEMVSNQVTLVNFGTRFGYTNPNAYHKLMQTAHTVYEITDYDAIVPRSLATDLLIDSLQIKFVKEGDYIPFWKTEDGFVKITQHTNTDEMKSKYSYVTTDYLDLYHSK